MAFVAAVSFILLEECSGESKENLRRRCLRDISDPLSLPEEIFIEHFRLNKKGFVTILNKIGSNLNQSSIPAAIQLAAILRFFAEGSFQRSVGNVINIAMHRTTVSKTISNLLRLLERKICPELININPTEQN